MKNNLGIVAYYIYALIVVILTGYVVFILNYSGWWFLLTLVLLDETKIKIEIHENESK